MGILEISRVGKCETLQDVKQELLKKSYNEIATVNWKDSHPHKLDVKFYLGYDDTAIFIHYVVKGECVNAAVQNPNGEVYQDSCCELFISPDSDSGYYNIEVNAIGSVLMGYGVDKGSRYRLDPKLFSSVETLSSLGVDPIENLDTDWDLTVKIPYSTFIEHPNFKLKEGSEYRCNLYKCGDLTAKPHYISWNPILIETPNFHKPEFFGTMVVK